MLIQIYDALRSDTETIQGNKKGDINLATSFEYRKKLYNYGTFTLIIPTKTLFADTIMPSTMLFVDKKYWLIVTGVIDNEKVLEISGYDLKYLLALRTSLYGMTQDTGTTGYDVATGSTETVLKHYIANNLSAPTDVNRKIVGLEIATDQNRGIADDTYMSRFEPVNELAEKICKNAKIGYDIIPNFETNKYVFDVFVGEDKTAQQTERNRVVFSIDRKNVAAMRYEADILGKNAFYATKTGGTLETDAVTVLVSRDETVPTGIDRREIQINVSCDSTADIGIYAEKEMENYMDTLSLDCSIKGFDEFESIYFLGDTVTVKKGDITLDTLIAEANITYAGEKKSLSLVFGDKKPKILNKLKQEINNKGV